MSVPIGLDSIGEPGEFRVSHEVAPTGKVEAGLRLEIGELNGDAHRQRYARNVAGLEELYPNGGFLGTGFRMWGINGTTRVLIEYSKAVRNKGLLLEPVDIKKDLYGFVYCFGTE
jgi:hypothetical protein